MKENLIVKKTFEFSLDIIELYKQLTEKKEFILSKQLFRSGTSIGANVREATAGQTKKDFITKMAIASKEARETLYWLQLLQQSQLIAGDYTRYISTADEIVKILTSIVKTAQKSNN